MDIGREMPQFLAQGNDIRGRALSISDRLDKILSDLRGPEVHPNAVDGSKPLPPTSLSDYLLETLNFLDAIGEQLNEIERLI